MKSIIIKITLLFSLFLFNCKAQQATVNDYINFYNDITPKLNVIATNKTQFYNQPFSNFNAELNNNNISIINIGIDTKNGTGNQYYILRLYFCDNNMEKVVTDNSFRYPWISITFENEIPNQTISQAKQYNGEWNYNLIQLFENMKIQNIKFLGLNGFDSTDYSAK